MSPTPTRHWFANHVFNPLVAGLTRLGVSVRGSRILAVRGRKCGVRRIRPPSSAESDQADRLNPTTQFGVSDHLGEDLAAA
jgi:hypothetical protein